MWRSQSIKEGKRKQYDQGRPSMMKGKQHRESRARKNSFFPCLERQESLVELDMVIILRIRTIGWSVPRLQYTKYAECKYSMWLRTCIQDKFQAFKDWQH